MAVDAHEMLVQLLGTPSEGGQEVVINHSAGEQYTIDNVASLIESVLEKASALLGSGPRIRGLRLSVRVRSAEGLRACLSLSAEAIRQVASLSAALDFDPFPVLTVLEDEWSGETGQSEPRTRPELVVVLVGDSPSNGKERVLSKVSRQWYTDENLRITVAEAISEGRLNVEGDIALWEPQVGVRLSSDRANPASMFLSSDLIHAMALCGASLDFDPYV